MVEHRSKHILAVGRGARQFHSLRNGGAERTLIVGIVGNNVLTGASWHTWRCYHLCAVGLHDRAAIGLLVIRHLHHIHCQCQAEVLCRQRQRRAPLSSASFGGDVRHALLLAVVGLCYCRVELMRPHRAYALVLKIDMCRRVKKFLQSACSHQRGRAPNLIHFAHLLRNFNPLVGGVEFLVGASLIEQRIEVLRLHGLLVGWVKHRARLIFHISHHVVPCSGNIFFLKEKFLRRVHSCKF